MEFNTILQAIATVGFPIVMCLLLIWYIKDTNEKTSENIKEITAKHLEETKEFTEALNKNTLVLQRLCDKLEG